ncbi:hypothetical protein LTR66_006005 [Elasticomyces elasticus]|nr:hypothetical protein LTR66_006005 [Elasticomyces elasticus]
MDTEDGQLFVKAIRHGRFLTLASQNLAYYVRTHEKALANALQLQKPGHRNGQTSSPSGDAAKYSTSSTLAAALSLPYLNFTSHKLKPVKLTLTPHHLFYLLSRFEELGVAVGSMNIRLEDIHADSGPGNYVSFQGSVPKSKGRGYDAASIHSVSSVRSVISSVSSMWSHFSITSSVSKLEKQQAQAKEDLRYLYSAFTKIPCLRLAPDHKSRLIAGFEEFPFDTAVPLFVFKNLSALEICDLDFRQFFGWDKLAEQLRSLSIKRGSVDDPVDLFVNVVLDDIDKRRRRSSKAPPFPTVPWPAHSPTQRQVELVRSISAPNSPIVESRRASIGSPQSAMVRGDSSELKKTPKPRQRSNSPSRPSSARYGSSNAHPRGNTSKLRRSSTSSGSSIHSNTQRNSSSNLSTLGALHPAKWRFLRLLSLSENGLTTISTSSLMPIANTLQSLDLSNNLFTEVPDSLASLTHLRALNLSNCMIDSLRSLSRNPLPAITTLNLRGNRLSSLAGIEGVMSLEKVDLRDNRIGDPTELARLTAMPEMQEIYVLRNPFIRTHANYRVTIFNLFRKTPGYQDDIVLDTTGPSYSERKQLADRVPEAANRPVMQLPQDDESPPPVPPKDPAVATNPQAQQEESASPPASAHRRTSDYSGGTARRKKGARRRLVELSHTETISSSPAPQARMLDFVGLTPILSIDSTYGGSPETTPGKPPTTVTRSPSKTPPPPMPVRPPIKTAETSPAFVRQLSPGVAAYDDDATREFQDLGISGDIYRQKIEALKRDLGNGWLSALGDDGWELRQQREEEERREREFGPARNVKAVAGGGGQSIEVGGRRLG